jgi:hypothetical protein
MVRAGARLVRREGWKFAVAIFQMDGRLDVLQDAREGGGIDGREGGWKEREREKRDMQSESRNGRERRRNRERKRKSGSEGGP